MRSMWVVLSSLITALLLFSVAADAHGGTLGKLEKERHDNAGEMEEMYEECSSHMKIYQMMSAEQSEKGLLDRISGRIGFSHSGVGMMNSMMGGMMG